MRSRAHGAVAMVLGVVLLSSCTTGGGASLPDVGTTGPRPGATAAPRDFGIPDAWVGVSASGTSGSVTGSGAAVGGEIVVTAAHVVSGASAPIVLTRSRSFTATVAFVDAPHDLAVLRVAGLQTGQAAWASPRAGAVVGVPTGPSETSAYRSAVVQDVVAGDLLLSGAAPHGVSGSPVVDDRGRVAGVVVSGSFACGYLRAVSAETVRSALRSAAL